MNALVHCPPQEVIEIINYPEETPQARDRLILRYIKSKGKLPRKVWRHLHRLEVGRWLRSYVEEWLKTGLNPDGSESPCRKNLYQTFHAHLAVLRSLEEHPPEVGFDADSGDLQIFVDRVRLDTPTEPQLFFQERVKDAAQLFVAVLASDWRNSLCKCRYARCGRYFIHPKPRQHYEHGTFCSREHQAHASAEECSRRSRLSDHTKLVDEASRWLSTRGNLGIAWDKDGRRKTALLRALNKNITDDPILSQRRDAVGMKWVTRHRATIERMRATLASKS